MSKQTVDEYVAQLSGWQAEAVAKVRALVKHTVPNVQESIKWAQPVFELNGPFSYVKAFKQSVNFGFIRGSDLVDVTGRLEGTGANMRHIKLNSVADIDAALLADLVRQAVELNQTKGDATTTK